jgi:hypothetical protein
VPAGVITFGEIASRLTMLDVRRYRCPRQGRLNIDCLLDEHGPGLPMKELRRIVG